MSELAIDSAKNSFQVCAVRGDGSLSGVANFVASIFVGLDAAPWVIVVLVSIIYLTLGMMMDLGYDPIWFGVFVVLLIEIGAMTPPVGINCFVVQAASGGRLKLEDVFRGLIPFVLAGFAMLVLLYLAPQLATFLPSRM